MKIPAPLHRRLKVEAAMAGTTVWRIAEDALTAELDRRAKERSVAGVTA